MNARRARVITHKPLSCVEDVAETEIVRTGAEDFDTRTILAEGVLAARMSFIASLPCSPAAEHLYACPSCLAREVCVATGNLFGIWDLFEWMREVCR